MYRSYVFKAWAEPESAPMLIEQGHRLMRTYAQALKIVDLNEARQYVYQNLDDLWYASRQMASIWIKGQNARKLMKRKARPEDEDPEVAEAMGYDAVLGGVVNASELSWEKFIEHGEKYRVFCRTIRGGDRPLLELTTPVWTDKSKERVRIRFLMHRPIPKDAMIHRFFIIMRPKRREGRVIGYAFYLSFMIKIEKADLRRPKRMGTLQPAWKVENDGSILVLGLDIEYMDGTTAHHEYHLPPGTIQKARKAQHLSITGQDNVEYRHYDRWRQDQYRKIATDVCKRTDALKMKTYKSGESIPGTVARHRPFVSVAKLIAAISERAAKEGVSMMR